MANVIYSDEEIDEIMRISENLLAIRQSTYKHVKYAELILASPLSRFETLRKTQILGVLHSDIMYANEYVCERASLPIYEDFVKLVDGAVEKAKFTIGKLEIALSLANDYTELRCCTSDMKNRLV
ncbi:hypothetical protein HYW75_04900 [Candidatus Pacearchaeota archaeon]|nr:hypothetical protein [Candidatus Pacearchaeota archaeon]